MALGFARAKKMRYYLDKHYGNQNDHKASNIVHEVITKGGQAAVWVDLHGRLRNMRVCKMVQQTTHQRTELSSKQDKKSNKPDKRRLRFKKTQLNK
jgi:phage/plasmid primase-like uncharacterized protein